MKLLELVNIATSRKASDIHLTVGLPPVFRINGELIILDSEKLIPNDTKSLAYESLNDDLINILEEKGEGGQTFG